MDQHRAYAEGDLVRVREGAFASFRGRVVKVNNLSERLVLQGRPEGDPASALHTVNVSFSVAEKITSTGNRH
jgi:transcription antitermination factor NusG